MKKLLTIGIPTFNRSEMLELSLQSLIMQTKKYSDYIEIVISDNGSEDNTSEMVKTYINNNEWITYKRNNKNLGVNNNVYKIANEYANGEFLWVIGDDDMIINGGIEYVLETIKENKDCSGFYVNYGVTSILNRDYAIKNNQSKYEFDSMEVFGDNTEKIRLNNVFELVHKVSNPIATFFGISSMIVRTKLWKDHTELDQNDTPVYTIYKYAYPHMSTFMRPFVNRPIVYIGKPIFLFASHDRNDGINCNLIVKWMNDYKKLLDEIGFDGEEKKLMNESCDKMIITSFIKELINSKVEFDDDEYVNDIIKVINAEKELFIECIEFFITDNDKKIIKMLINAIELNKISDLVNLGQILKQMNKNKKEKIINDYYKKISSIVIDKFINSSDEVYIWGSSELAYSIYQVVIAKDNTKKVNIIDGYYRKIGTRFFDTNINIEHPETLKENSKVIISSLNNYEAIKNRINNEYKDRKCDIL